MTSPEQSGPSFEPDDDSNERFDIISDEADQNSGDTEAEDRSITETLKFFSEMFDALYPDPPSGVDPDEIKQFEEESKQRAKEWWKRNS